MIALDTNVLVRFLVEDDAAQHRRATALIEKEGRAAEALLLTEVVLCEVVWVLRYSYKIQKARIVEVLRQLMNARQMRVQAKNVVVSAIDAYEGGLGDFADYLIREQALAAGASAVATFDGGLLDEDGFVEP